MNGLPTYENDKDLHEIIYSKEITNEQVLTFFRKKCGLVNIANLSYVVGVYAMDKNSLASVLVNLEATGMIKHTKHPMCKLTNKAWWCWVRDLKSWVFWAAICGILGLLVLLMQILRMI